MCTKGFLIKTHSHMPGIGPLVFLFAVLRAKPARGVGSSAQEVTFKEGDAEVVIEATAGRFDSLRGGKAKEKHIFYNIYIYM